MSWRSKLNNLALDVTPQSTVAEMLRSGALVLAGRSDSPRLDAELLLGSLLGFSRARAWSRMTIGSDRSLTEYRPTRVDRQAPQRLAGRVSHGHPAGSWSLELDVTPAVLVPRPETELVVELALDLPPSCRTPEGAPFSVLDLGTGSGAIALALAAERPEWRLTGVDISPPALEVAARNSRKNWGSRASTGA